MGSLKITKPIPTSTVWEEIHSSFSHVSIIKGLLVLKLISKFLHERATWLSFTWAILFRIGKEFLNSLGR